MAMKNLIYLVIFLVLICFCSCVPFKEVEVYPTIQHDIQPTETFQSTTNVTQYDYKAGAPNIYPNITSEGITNTFNPYLYPDKFPSIDSYLIPMNPSVPTTYWTPSFYYNYLDTWYPPKESVIFWSGTAEVIVLD